MALILHVTVSGNFQPIPSFTMAFVRFTLEDGTLMDCQLDADTLTIGRHPDNDVPLSCASISSHHARIRRESDGLWVSDLGSTNGTRINGETVDEAMLEHGDKLRFGDIRAAYYEAEPDAIEEESGQLPVDASGRRAESIADEQLRQLPQVETAAIHVKASDGSVVTASSAQQQQRAAARGAARGAGRPGAGGSRARQRGKGPVRPARSTLATDRLGLVVFLFIVGVAFCTVLGLTVRHYKETGGFLPADMFDKVRHLEVRRADGEPQQERPIRGRQTVVPPADE